MKEYYTFHNTSDVSEQLKFLVEERNMKILSAHISEYNHEHNTCKLNVTAEYKHSDKEEKHDYKVTVCVISYGYDIEDWDHTRPFENVEILYKDIFYNIRDEYYLLNEIVPLINNMIKEKYTYLDDERLKDFTFDAHNAEYHFVTHNTDNRTTPEFRIKSNDGCELKLIIMFEKINKESDKSDDEF